MKLVVDTNVLFSFFKKESHTRKILLAGSLKLISPEVALKELQKYSDTLMIKSKISKDDLDSLFSLLKEKVEFVPLHRYSDEFKKVLKLAESFSQKDLEEFLDDLDFFALASKEICPIWSRDALFKKQSSIKVFNTTDLIKHLK